jgi:hypothetical protein
MTTPTLSAYFASPDTASFPAVMLVPSWVVSGPREPQDKTADDLAPCALGITYSQEWSEALGGADECDVCHDRAAAWDENGTAYCARHLFAEGDTYGVVLTSLVTFLPYDECAPSPLVEVPDYLASL